MRKFTFSFKSLLVAFLLVGGASSAWAEATWTASNKSYASEDELSSNTSIVSVKLGNGTWTYHSGRSGVYVASQTIDKTDGIPTSGGYIVVKPTVDIFFLLSTYSSQNAANLVMIEGSTPGTELKDFRQKDYCANNFGKLDAGKTYYIYGRSFKKSEDLDYIFYRNFTAVDKVSATIGATGYATFSSDYALDFSKATLGLEAYMITGHEGNVITKSQVTGTVPAGTGLLLKGDAGDYNIPIVGSSSTDVSTNLMVAGTGASVSKEDDKTKYVLGVNNNDTAGDTSDDFAEFQKIVDTPATVPTGKAYLQFNEEISVKSLSFIDDGKATGVDAPVAAEAEEDGIYYNLNGQQVTKDYKGIVIVNGKKFFNK